MNRIDPIYVVSVSNIKPMSPAYDYPISFPEKFNDDDTESRSGSQTNWIWFMFILCFLIVLAGFITFLILFILAITKTLTGRMISSDVGQSSVLIKRLIDVSLNKIQIYSIHV